MDDCETIDCEEEEEEFEDMQFTSTESYKNRHRHSRRKSDYLKEKRRIDITEYTYYIGSVDKQNKYFKPKSNSSIERYYKKVANRKVRHNPNCFNNGGYKKVYDYWWSIW